MLPFTLSLIRRGRSRSECAWNRSCSVLPRLPTLTCSLFSSLVAGIGRLLWLLETEKHDANPELGSIDEGLNETAMPCRRNPKQYSALLAAARAFALDAGFVFGLTTNQKDTPSLSKDLVELGRGAESTDLMFIITDIEPRRSVHLALLAAGLSFLPLRSLARPLGFELEIAGE